MNLENDYKHDKELQEMQKHIQEQMDKVVAGNEPDQKTDIPEFMTPQKTLEIMFKVMEENSVEIYRYCKKAISQGLKVNTQDPTFMMGL